MRTNNNKGRRPAGGTGKGKSGFSGGRDKKSFKSDRVSREDRGNKEEGSERGSFSRERKSGAGDRNTKNRSNYTNRDEKPSKFNKEGRSFSKDRDGFKGNDDKSKNFRREDKPFSKEKRDHRESGDKRSFNRDENSFSKEKREYREGGEKRNFKRDGNSFSKEKREYRDGGDKKRFSRDGSSFSKEKRGFDDKNEKPKRYKKEGQTVDNPNYFKNKERSNSEEWSDNDFERSKKSKSERTFKPTREKREGEKQQSEEESQSSYTDKRNSDRKEFIERKSKRREQDEKNNDRVKRKRSDKPSKEKNENGETLIRLNKFISNSGVCSRREADKLIESGAVTVNGKIVSELGYKVNPTDVVNYGGASIKREKNVYVLLNKPKDYITTLDDPEGRKTVMELVKSACKERIYPVGRLDRNTTGLLLFTNDGDMTMKLTHPKNNIQKLYGVEIDKSIRPEDFKAILDGFELEDGFIKADKLEFVGGSTNRKELGIEIHSGKNRIVRRIFEHLGYKVVKLDRVMFAGLTKKDLPRGKWRFLTEKEIGYLRMKK
jgi:23S rRNA pseudouridine2605 synthase